MPEWRVVEEGGQGGVERQVQQAVRLLLAASLRCMTLRN